MCYERRRNKMTFRKFFGESRSSSDGSPEKRGSEFFRCPATKESDFPINNKSPNSSQIKKYPILHFIQNEKANYDVFTNNYNLCTDSYYLELFLIRCNLQTLGSSSLRTVKIWFTKWVQPSNSTLSLSYYGLYLASFKFDTSSWASP